MNPIFKRPVPQLPHAQQILDQCRNHAKPPPVYLNAALRLWVEGAVERLIDRGMEPEAAGEVVKTQFESWFNMGHHVVVFE